jgi:hypothetical protein
MTGERDMIEHNPDGFVHATPEQARIVADAVKRRFVRELSQAIFAAILQEHGLPWKTTDEAAAACDRIAEIALRSQSTTSTENE